ncbi:MAG: HAMP domain-containing protein, partial [Verrucomicrobiota bacterium]
MVTSSVSLLVAIVFMLINDFSLIRGNMKRNLLTLGTIVAENSIQPLSRNDPDTAGHVLRSLTAEQHIRAAAIYTVGPDGSSTVFARYQHPDVEGDLIPAQAPADIVEFVGENLALAQEIVDNEKEMTVGKVYMLSDTKAIEARTSRYAVIIVVAVLIACGVTFLLSLNLQGVITDPLISLVEVARDVSERRDFSVRAEKQTEDELGVLVDNFNAMLEEIQTAEEETRR